MSEKGLKPDNVQLTYDHLLTEICLGNICHSLGLEHESILKAHNAIHEFRYLAPNLYPDDESTGERWQKKSAFLVNLLEIFSLAHRSLIESLCANYNTAFILLRSVLELAIKSAFYECLSHRKYRENSNKLEGKKLKTALDEIIEQKPDFEKTLENVSASIYDVIDRFLEDPKYHISMRDIIDQLEQWHMFDPMPNPIQIIYKELYRDLSADVHLKPNSTDIGRRLVTKERELFEQNVLKQTLHEYTQSLLKVMDVTITVEINIMKDIIEHNQQNIAFVKEKLDYFNQLGLRYSFESARTLVE